MLHIDFRDARPIYEQIVDGIKDMVMHGILQPDEQLPSVRKLAMELSINPNTIQKAYAELESQNISYSVKGRGSFISSDCTLLRNRRLNEIHEEIAALVKEAKGLGATMEQLELWIKENAEKEGTP